jgi:hypothetical protein
MDAEKMGWNLRQEWCKQLCVSQHINCNANKLWIKLLCVITGTSTINLMCLLCAMGVRRELRDNFFNGGVDQLRFLQAAAFDPPPPPRVFPLLRRVCTSLRRVLTLLRRVSTLLRRVYHPSCLLRRGHTSCG